MTDPRCYLCGRRIKGTVSDDHVPPKLLVPSAMRGSTQLTTLPTHRHCNNSYSADEEYLRAALAMVGEPNAVTEAVFDDIEKSVSVRPTNRLYPRIWESISERAGSVYLPAGLYAFNSEQHRVRRVLWKIARGIYTLYAEDFLPENATHRVEFFQRAGFQSLTKSILADYIWNHYQLVPDAFEVLVLPLGAPDDREGHGWCILYEIWKCVWAMVYFHAADCTCTRCSLE